MSDDYGRGNPDELLGAEHDDERTAPSYDAAAGDEGTVSLPPLQPGWEQTVDETVASAAAEVIPRSPFDELPAPVRAPDPDEVPHLYVEDGAMRGHCVRCGGWPTDRVHQEGARAAIRDTSDGYRSKAEEWEPQDGPDGTYMRPPAPPVDVWATASGPRRDLINDIGAGEAPPSRHLADFECAACGLTFKADDDTTTCPRCSVGRLERLHVLVEAGPTMAELREAGVINLLGIHRDRLDDIWSEIASSIVTVLGAGRRAVEAWQTAPEVHGTGELFSAMEELATAMGMRPGPDGTVPHPHGPLAELLQETAEMMRAEAATLDKAAGAKLGSPVPRIEGAARRLREHAELITRTVGEPDR